MCGRFGIVPDAQGLLDFFKVFGEASMGALLTSERQDEVRPTDRVPVVIGAGDGGVQIARLSWMFRPRWWRDENPLRHTFNARVEEAPTSRMWGPALQTTRCLVPVSWWYEWPVVDGRKAKTRIRARSGAVMGVAGLWSPSGGEVGSFTMMTTAPVPDLEKVHSRMPLVLTEGAWARWLSREPVTASDVCRFAVESLAREFTVEPAQQN